MKGNHNPRGGTLNPNCRLTPEIVAEIRASASTTSARETAAKHGISRSLVHAIRQGRRWAVPAAVGATVTAAKICLLAWLLQ